MEELEVARLMRMLKVICEEDKRMSEEKFIKKEIIFLKLIQRDNK